MLAFTSQYNFRKQLLLVYGLMFFCFTLSAQQFKRFDYLPVSNFGASILNPWTGGINSVQFGKTDVNHDGNKDLIVFDKNNKKFLVFLNNGNQPPKYLFNSAYSNYFPNASGWMVMKDYNCDGIEDIFTYNGIGNIMVYTGYYQADTIRYRLQQNGLFYQGISGKINVYCSEVIKPAIADINNDGDLDIISFNVVGDRLIFYENQQKELNLTCDSLFFTKSDNCWGNIRDSFAAAFALRDTCGYKFNRISNTESIEHTGSCLEAYDIDANGAIDLLIGSVTLSDLTALYNDGNKNYASILRQEVDFPKSNISFNANSFGVPTFIDIDNDNAVDLLVSTFDVGAANINNIWYYKNTQTNSNQAMHLALQQKDFLLDNMIDAGENSYPCFFDVNGDGLIDILLGSNGFKDYVQPNVYKLLFYKNTGTATQPAFNLEDDDFLNISSLGLTDIAPTVGDMDNDGDLDLLIGTSDGRVAYWENTATTGNAPNLIYKGYLKDNNENEISIGSNATPALVDLNRDGKTDLIIGERNGNLNFYKGTSTHAVQLAFVTDSLGKILIKTNNFAIGYTQPTIADINKDGKYDLVLGTNTNGLLFYDNIEDKLNGIFIASSPLINFQNSRTSSSVADVTQDGEMELLVGNVNGGLMIYSKNPPPFIPTYLQKHISKLNMEIFPNPVNDKVTIFINEPLQTFQIQLFTIVGQEVLHKKYFAQNNIELNMSSFPNGIYLLKVANDEKESLQKIIIQH